MFLRSLAICFAFFGTALCAQDLPLADIPGSSDSDIAGRVPGSLIVSHFSTPLDRAEFPKSTLKRTSQKVGNNVYKVSPDEMLTVEGARTRNVYLLEPGVPPFAALRAYEASLPEQGMDIVYFCRTDTCGENANRAGSLGGNWMSLPYYLWPDDRITDNESTAGWCAQTGYISNLEYRLFRDDAKDTTVSVLAYVLNPSQFSSCKHNFENRTVVVVDVIAPDAAPIELETVNSEKMSDEISTTGKIALYGINFDSGKDSLRSESADTINQIAALMTSEGDLRLLIVGHTDSVGSFEYNQNLSERRAASVVRALVNQHGITQSRLYPVGVAFASPVATNDTDEGKAQNRRVELVKF